MTITTADIITGNALAHLPIDGTIPHVFTSLPDAAETGQDVDDWATWFALAARRVIRATDPNGYAIFYQTDRRHDGRLIDKAGMVANAAAAVGASIVWHKIAVRRMTVDLFRPTYTHLIVVSVNGRAGRPTPDVFTAGEKVYPNATDTAACDVALGFLSRAGATAVHDPFCGRGSIAYHAARYGMDTVSIDIDPEQTAAAAALLSDVADVTAGGTG